MSNLPFTLPTCERPADVRIEIYSAAEDGSSSSLDACVYTCTGHTTDVVASAWSADFNAYRVPVAPSVERPCGEVYIFPTGTLGGAK